MFVCFLKRGGFPWTVSMGRREGTAASEYLKRHETCQAFLEDRLTFERERKRFLTNFSTD
jgi:hypothetical protein